MKLDFSVLDAPVRASDKLEAEWCVPVTLRPTRSVYFFTVHSVRSGAVPDARRPRLDPPTEHTTDPPPTLSLQRRRGHLGRARPELQAPHGG